jgi:hypothetical protein
LKSAKSNEAAPAKSLSKGRPTRSISLGLNLGASEHDGGSFQTYDSVLVAR